MKPTRKSLFFVCTLVLAIAVMSAMPSLAHASDVRGTVKLPVAASWNGTLLPAGPYEYSVNYNGAATIVQVRNLDTMESALFVVQSLSEAPTTAKTSLVLTREGDSMFVSTLNLDGVSLAFSSAHTKPAPVMARVHMAAGNAAGPSAPLQ